MFNGITLLALNAIGIPPYSARGLSQTLTPIEQATSMRRTVNGTLVDLSVSQMRKFASSITGADMDPPAFDGVWPGLQLQVDCLPELCFETTTESEEGTETDEAFARPAVPGSIRHADGFTFYRPRLTMMVTGFNVNRNEWGAVTDWTLNLEEV